MKLPFYKGKKNQPLDFDNISFKKGFVFVHIPKNAGTSICMNLGIRNSRHYTVNEYISMLGEPEYKNLFSFAFVRNPFSRFLSLYNYARMEESYYHSSINPDKAIYGKHMDYDTLINVNVEEAAQLLVEGKLVHNPPHNQWEPQVKWLKDTNGNLKVKYIGRFEDIALHMRNIHKLIGTDQSFNLQKINSSSKVNNDYRKLISSNTRSILETYYKEDLETFNYDF